MDLQFFTYLPPEIIVDILSRLPVRTIAICKCVCKPWLHLLRTPQFADSHLSKSVAGLAICETGGNLKIFEFRDKLGLELDKPHCNPITTVDVRSFIAAHHHSAVIWILGSINGLLLLRESKTEPDAIFVCNPITREYIELPGFGECYPIVDTYGFGVSRLTRQHKVVRVSYELSFEPTTEQLLAFQCHVYTLGTGSWRSITPGGMSDYQSCSDGPCLNGNLHWLIGDSTLTDTCFVFCLDLETEVFSAIYAPPTLSGTDTNLVLLMDCLCISESDDDEVVIWMMKEYGDEKSWTKEFVINEIPNLAGGFKSVYPVEIFKDDDILMHMFMRWNDLYLVYYNRSGIVERIDIIEGRSEAFPMLHRSSFFSLESFPVENVSRF